MPAGKHIIRYSQCWEDAGMMLNALSPQPGDTVLSITSGGCNTLALASAHPASLITVDLNPAQMHLFMLKKAAIQNLGYQESLRFLGVDGGDDRTSIYRGLELPDETRKYWDLNIPALRNGIIHCGKFEQYLKLFRKLILPLVQGKKNIEKILSVTDKKEQLEFYHARWNNWRWKLLFGLFFSKQVMNKRGRSREMFRYAGMPAGTTYFQRTEKALSAGEVSNNCYLEYILTGNFRKALPVYLRQDVWQKIRTFNAYEAKTGDLLSVLKDMPDSGIDVFNLSDVFEALPDVTTQQIFSEIRRTGKNGARILFWNNLVLRNVPPELFVYFRREKAKEVILKQQDQIFFYETFYLYTLVK